MSKAKNLYDGAEVRDFSLNVRLLDFVTFLQMIRDGHSTEPESEVLKQKAELYLSKIQHGKSWDFVLGKFHRNAHDQFTETLTNLEHVATTLIEIRGNGVPLNNTVYDKVAIALGIGRSEVTRLWKIFKHGEKMDFPSEHFPSHKLERTPSGHSIANKEKTRATRESEYEKITSSACERIRLLRRRGAT